MNASSPPAEPLDILWIGTPGDGQKALARLVPAIRVSAHDEDSALVVLASPDVQPDLLVVDATDSAVDALAVLERLRTTSIDLPVVLLSAPGDLLVTRAAQVALCDVVVKTADFVQQLPHAFTQARTRHDLAAMFRSSRQTEERLRTILEFQPAVTCLIAPDGSISAINQAGLLLLGGGSEQVQGRSITNFVPAGERDGLVAILRRSVAGETLEFDHAIARPDGTIVPVTLRVVPLRTGEAVSVVATIIQRRVQTGPDAATLDALDHALVEVESLRAEREQHRSEQEQRAKAEIERAALAAALDDARAKGTAAESALAETKSQLLSAESTLETERASSAARSNAVSEARAHWNQEHERLEQLHAEHTTLAATLADTREQLAFAESAFATERAEWAEQTRLMATERSEWTRRREQHEEMRRASSALGETLSETRARLSGAESTLDAERQAHTAERAESERERSRWQAERETWAVERGQWVAERDQLAQITTERDALTLTVEEGRVQLAAAEAGLAAERATWSAKYAAALGDRTQWTAERQQHEKLQVEYARLSNAGEQARSAIAALEAELAREREEWSRRDHDARVAHDGAVADRDAERQRAAALRSEIAALRTRIEELQNLQRRAAADHESMLHLRRELLRFTTEIENQCRTVIERQEENLRLTEEVGVSNAVEPITR